MLSQAKWTTRANVLHSSDIFHTCTNKWELSSVNFAHFFYPFPTELRSELPALFNGLPLSFASPCETLISFLGLEPRRGMWFLSWAVLDCSQSPIFSWDRWRVLLLMTAILMFKYTEGKGVGDYTSIERGREKYFSRFLPNHPHRQSSFHTHARWQPVTQSTRSRRSYGKIEDCEQSRATRHDQERMISFSLGHDLS